jgi:hypothetical protein
MVCTSDRFARKEDGKAVGLECVTTVFEEVSACESYQHTPRDLVQAFTIAVPLHVAPQMAHVKVTFFFPALPSSRLPQSLQKMREPIADMVDDFVVVKCEDCCGFKKKSDRESRGPVCGRAGTPAAAALV